MKWEEHICRFSWEQNHGDKRYRSPHFVHFTDKCKVTVKDKKITEGNHYNLIMVPQEDYDEHDVYKKESVLFKCRHCSHICMKSHASINRQLPSLILQKGIHNNYTEKML